MSLGKAVLDYFRNSLGWNSPEPSPQYRLVDNYRDLNTKFVVVDSLNCPANVMRVGSWLILSFLLFGDFVQL